jgi:glycosyltransferase involved in cell wall biosynthesis
MRTLVIVPAFNEEEAVPATLAELRATVPDVDIVVVDDGSRDSTSTVARQVGVFTLELPFNTGVGGAVRTGLRFARQQRYDRAVVVDADGQHDPSGISALLERLDAGADLVIGSRFADPTSEYHVGRARRYAMRLLGGVVHRITGQRFTDVTSGYRAFSRPAIQLLAGEYPLEYLADTVEVLLIAHRAGLAIDEVAVTMRVRAGGVPSSRNFRLVVNYLRLLVEIACGGYRHPRTTGMEPT